MPAFQKKASSGSEAALVERWLAGRRGISRTEDGRAVRVLFPGIPGGGAGPDVRDAVLELAGDALRGDIEVHLKARGWYEHGHHDDPAYGNVILHLVAENDGGTLASDHVSGHSIPIAVTEQRSLPSHQPPCALHPNPMPTLAVLGTRRLEAKSAAIAAAVASEGPAQSLFELLLKTAGGPANGAAFRQLACALRLAPLLERAPERSGREQTLAALLSTWAQPLALSTRGRPASHPARRLDAVASLVDRLWPAGALPEWPSLLRPGASLSRELKVPGLGAGLICEVITNAILPVAVAAGRWTLTEAAGELASLGAPATYGRLKRLEGWLSSEYGKPFKKASLLQGGLLLHAEYCSRGRCGRCPLSPV